MIVENKEKQLKIDYGYKDMKNNIKINKKSLSIFCRYFYMKLDTKIFSFFFQNF